MSTLVPFRNLDVDESGDLVLGLKTRLKGYHIYNNASSTRYIKFYDKKIAPTVGTDTPKMTVPLPAGSAANIMFGEDSVPFDYGIGVGATTAVADNDTGAPGANDVVVLFYLG